MPIYSPENTAEENLAIVAANPYPGRILVIGFFDPFYVQAYGITGRSEGSRNRVLVEQDGVVSTEVANPDLEVGDPETTIYDAMRRMHDTHIVSNGNQTDTIIKFLRGHKTVADSLSSIKREPDKPNFTARITGFHNVRTEGDEPLFGLALVHKDKGVHGSVRKLYTDSDKVGTMVRMPHDKYGLALQTYEEDRPPGEPLPPFTEAPFSLPVADSAEAMAELLWENLDRENRVAVVAKTIKPSRRGGVEIRFKILPEA